MRNIINNIFNYIKKEKEENIIIPLRPGEKPIKNPWLNLKPINLDKIQSYNFPESEYILEQYEKTQIVLHHTMSGDGVNGDIMTWEDDPRRIAVCIIIDRGGTPWQLFSSKYWAYHLGAGNSNLDKHSIGIEIDNWGWLIPTSSGKYKTYYGNEVYAFTQYYPNKYRGYHYYEKYTDAQIQTVGELLLFWNKRYNIPLDYHEDMWNVSSRALQGEPGIWSHVSYRNAADKQDCHPQPQLKSMLKILKYIK